MRTNDNIRGLVVKGDKVLLIHRFKHGDEYWVVPGGGVEKGESLEQVLKLEKLYPETIKKYLKRKIN